MAPELTIMISFPEFFSSESTLTSRSMRLRLTCPVSYVRVEVPILTTTRFALLKAFA